ncbi:hypothetical protein E2C01_090899 [Portunus trituberculatus]|uniref:Uncharacterized protein n=1 Tax=Portunus trituberculatus TaxID=210409 RepID=A0A5B7JLK1_PORTR|nr:hypothetical protein [Portunus trituberculatus]
MTNKNTNLTNTTTTTPQHHFYNTRTSKHHHLTTLHPPHQLRLAEEANKKSTRLQNHIIQLLALHCHTATTPPTVASPQPRRHLTQLAATAHSRPSLTHH